MRKVFTALVLAAFLVLLVGCNPKLANFSVAEEKENGIYVLVTDETNQKHQWYANIDTSTERILSVNLIYPAEYGAPKETESSGGGKVTMSHQEDEKNGGGVMFYTLTAEDSALDNDNKITITQSFQNKEKVRIVFIPAKMEDAFKKEY